jgi:ribulose-5-phosphate 4-epimerase/fuculose-1-phosphate aldolase
MTITTASVDEATAHFADETASLAARVFEVFRETGTITANGTVNLVERVPGQDLVVVASDPGPFHRSTPVEPAIVAFDGTFVSGPAGVASSGARFVPLFVAHPDITTVSHVHSPSLGAWAQSHRPLPIRYVPVQRHTLALELPIYIDRRQQEADFILDRLNENPEHFAILEANGGATVWGREGAARTAEVILLLEEGAALQLLAESLGGSQDYGPGVLDQQWKMGGLTERARALGLLPA